ncbi:MAG: phosphopyruvate hydratase [Candidatus Bathyarchaeota archaeon]
MPAVILSVKARKTFNSRGSKTIEIEVTTKNSFGRAEAPSGASTGSNEVAAYPSGGVEEAIRIVEKRIAPKLIGLNAEKQVEIDNLLHDLDGTKDFRKIGGNTSIAISLAVCKTAASSMNKPFFQYLSEKKPVMLPHPLGNVLGGGKHAGGKSPDIQEFLVLPVEASSFSEAAWANVRVHAGIRELLEKADATFTGGKGDEGAWAPNLENDKALDIVARVSENVSKELGVGIRVGLDMASSTLWDANEKSYIYRREGVKRSSGEQIDYVLDLIKTYRLIYVEDPLHEEDFEGFAEITRRAKSCLICGDDLFTTDPKRLRRGARLKAGNAIIIKPNQIGTLTETMETIGIAKSEGYLPVVSHRSGETCDTYLAHLAVGFECPIIKVGVVGGERIAKVNELLRIEEFLGEKAKIAELNLK